MRSWSDLSIRQKLVGLVVGCGVVLAAANLLTAYVVTSRADQELLRQQGHVNQQYIQSRLDTMQGMS